MRGKPIVQHAIENLKRYRIVDIILSIGYKAGEIKKYFGEGSKFGVNISYCVEDEPLGTGGAVKLAAKGLTEPFILVWGDNLIDIDYDKILDAHRRNNATLTIALTKRDDLENWGVAKLDNQKIIAFVEKPKRNEAPSNLINAGVFVVEPEALEILPDGKSSIEYDCLEKLCGVDGKVFAYIHDSQWFPTDNLEKLEIARRRYIP